MYEEPAERRQRLLSERQAIIESKAPPLDEER
jgi:hypothetical protein